ncbi:MAG: beta-phosphoglucomutase [Sphaerochaeta sp.]|uniref:beta-phosphoglucomutase n=1 Tax=Sphaerochaeta sp. TaxID=1972642 RepID=UPI003D0E74C1
MDTMRYVDAACDRSVVSRNETLLTVANGYLGLRGDTEEAEGSYHKGTYINGFYDSEPIQYGETAYGYAKNHQTLLNLPDPKRIELEVDGQSFSLKTGKLLSSVRTLDFQRGRLERHVDWMTDGGKQVEIETTRLVSFVEKHGAVITYQVKATTGPIVIRITSYLDLASHNRRAEEDPRVGSKFSSVPLIIMDRKADGSDLSFSARTRNSNLTVHGAVVHRVIGKEVVWNCDPQNLFVTCSLALEAGQCVTMEKYIAYTTEDDAALFLAHSLAQKGYDYLAREQESFLAEFWNVAQVHIEGDEDCEQALHFNIFHLLQSTGRDGKTSLAAKGLTGEGYEGHYFWDTEAYALPLFAYTKSAIARSLLEYRYSILDQARKRARTLSLDGALFPWRTINGEECSAYFPAGTAQYHIDADILYAAEKYLGSSGEDCPVFILEMAIESARMWVSLGSFSAARNGRFCIHTVTGPDEYSACVDNNAYTNLMAQNNLRFTLRLIQAWKEAGKRLPLDVKEEELELFSQAAEHMYIPYNSELGIIEQDDSFLSKPDWPFACTPRDQYPLLLHFHPLVIYRHRVLKQPDVVLAMFFLSSRFSKAEKQRNFSFYEPYTTGDSSLSHCIQSIMASEVGFSLKAWNYFTKTVRMDLDDVHGNSADGIHTAAMAGSWMSLVYGFGGFCDTGDVFSFDPKVPEAWKGFSFCLNLRGSVVRLHCTKEEATYTLMQGPAISLVHRMQSFVLDDRPAVFSLKPVLKAVVFDLDGVVVDTARLHYLAWKQISDAYGLLFDQTVNQKLLGVSRSASLDIILAHNHVEWTDEQKQRVLEEKNAYYRDSLASLGPGDVLEGMTQLFAALKQEGIRLALASASRNARIVLEKLGMLEVFDAICDVNQVALGKPEPDLFLQACTLLALYPADCLGVEDAEAGIQAIKKAGMKAIGVRLVSPLADFSVSSTKDLSLSLLQEVMKG